MALKDVVWREVQYRCIWAGGDEATNFMVAVTWHGSVVVYSKKMLPPQPLLAHCCALNITLQPRLAAAYDALSRCWRYTRAKSLSPCSSGCAYSRSHFKDVGRRHSLHFTMADQVLSICSASSGYWQWQPSQWPYDGLRHHGTAHMMVPLVCCRPATGCERRDFSCSSLYQDRLEHIDKVARHRICACGQPSCPGCLRSREYTVPITEASTVRCP